MKDPIELLKKNAAENRLTFSEDFYKSIDNKTIMGELSFKEILFLEYRESEAGGNPREYTGIKKTNENILKSLLKDCKNFRFLHSGIIVSVINPMIIDAKSIKYDFCCLTNGNQTRFIILIIVILKILSQIKTLGMLNQRDIRNFIKDNLSGNSNLINVMPYLKINKVIQIINFLVKNGKYLDSFNNINLNDFLDTRIRIQLNIIDNILDEIEDEADEYFIGTLIAEANNDTQKVKVDDIFGNKYKKELESKIFKHFIEQFSDKVKIEYRLGEVVEKVEKVHILTLLRPVAATGLITREKTIFKLTNQRDPIYKLFERLLRKDKSEKVSNIVSKIIPLLYRVRVEYVKPVLERHRRNLIMEYKEKASAGDLEYSVIKNDIKMVIDNDTELEKLIKKSVSFNIEHILPVVIFRIKDLFSEAGDNDSITLNLPKEQFMPVLKTLTENIYSEYVKMKLKGIRLSLSSAVRGREFYELGSETYNTLKGMLEFEETDFINRHRLII